ncbi:hypothetical protein ROZALSC1DRAFT_25366, partial [Rozella allomycis CSF55]
MSPLPSLWTVNPNFEKIQMAKKELGEVEKYRKSQKNRERSKQKLEKSFKKPSGPSYLSKDPSRLIRQIQKLQVLEFEGRLDPSGRMKKKTLMDKFNQVRASRAASGLPPIEMPEFDYERLMTEIKRENKAIQRGEKVDDGLDEYLDDELPPLPLGIPPPHELISYL